LITAKAAESILRRFCQKEDFYEKRKVVKIYQLSGKAAVINSPAHFVFPNSARTKNGSRIRAINQ